MSDNYFAKLFAVNVSGKIEKKNNLSYVSWPYAWAEIKKLFPDTTYTVYENKDGWNYHTDGRTCWVKTGLTVNGIEHIEMLPVMDFRNNSIPLERVTSMDVNKAIQRSLTKAAARHGLGLYVYAGEDLPEGETDKALDEAANDLPADAVKPGQKVDLPKKGDFNGLAAIAEWCNTRQIAMQDFAAARQTAIDKKWIADIKSKDLTETDCLTLFDAVEQILSGAVK